VISLDTVVNSTRNDYITGMAVDPHRMTRKLVSLPHELLRAIEDFRFQQRIKTESEAIRRLIETGLGKAKPAAPSGGGPGGARKPRTTGKTSAPRKAPERKAAPSSKLDQIRALREQGTH
jgi:hypothetical protein